MRSAVDWFQNEFVAKSEVLARVEADLALGRTHLAMQRLSSLTGAYPDDLELRARRAAIYRQIGNAAQAGRWGFLSEQVSSSEIDAFERACRPAGARLRSLRLRTDPSSGLGPLAHQRFTALVNRVEQEMSTPVTWAEAGSGQPHSRASWRDIISCLAAALIGLILLTLLVTGLVTVLGYITG